MNFPTFRLDGNIALITGSTKGIGYGIALGLAKAGANVIITSRNQAECEKVADGIRQFDSKTIGFACDVIKADQVANLVEKAIQEFGRIDILVNNAGTAITKKAEELNEDEYDQVVRLNERAVFFMAQAVGRQMIKQNNGKIINIASIFSMVGDRQVLPYTVAKGGVIQMTRSLALEWAKYNIRVNAVSPGYVITPMNEKDLKDEKIFNHVIKNIPMKRLGRVQDIVGATVFLASEAADYITGQNIVVDGGGTAQ